MHMNRIISALFLTISIYSQLFFYNEYCDQSFENISSIHTCTITVLDEVLTCRRVHLCLMCNVKMKAFLNGCCVNSKLFNCLLIVIFVMHA